METKRAEYLASTPFLNHINTDLHPKIRYSCEKGFVLSHKTISDKPQGMRKPVDANNIMKLFNIKYSTAMARLLNTSDDKRYECQPCNQRQDSGYED
jgi:hypothetical protein